MGDPTTTINEHLIRRDFRDVNTNQLYSLVYISGTCLPRFFGHTDDRWHEFDLDIFVAPNVRWRSIFDATVTVTPAAVEVDGGETGWAVNLSKFERRNDQLVLIASCALRGWVSLHRLNYSAVVNGLILSHT